MKRQQSAHRTMRFALFLGVIIILVIIFSVAIKIAIMIQRSTFDGQHQFILQVQHPRTTELLVFTPGSVSLTDVMLAQQFNSDTLRKIYGIPIDGKVTAGTTENPKDFTRSLLFHFGSFHPTMTYFDALRIFLFAQGVLPNNIHTDSLQLTSNNPGLQQRINKDFMDTTLYKESVSIAVVNATGVSGLGNNVAQLLSHVGFNVISVTSSAQVKAHSAVLYTGQSDYTLQRLEQLLHFSSQQTSSEGVADITITIGTDNAERFTP